MYRDESTGPLAHLFARTAYSFALLAVLCCAHLFICSIIHSQAREKVNGSMSQNDLVLSHSGLSKNLVKSFFHFSCQPILHLSVFIKNFRRYLAGYVLPLSTSGWKHNGLKVYEIGTFILWTRNSFSWAREQASEWASKQISTVERASASISVKPTNKWAVPANERMDQQMAQFKHSMCVDSIIPTQCAIVPPQKQKFSSIKSLPSFPTNDREGDIDHMTRGGGHRPSQQASHPAWGISEHPTMGQNQVILRHQKFTFPRAREWANERTDERVAQYLRLDSCLFQTTVLWAGEMLSTDQDETGVWWAFSRFMPYSHVIRKMIHDSHLNLHESDARGIKIAWFCAFLVFFLSNPHS